MNESRTRADRWLALGLGTATFAILWATQRGIGFARDEGYYFSAASSYQAWFVELGRAFTHGRFLEPFRDEIIVRYWSSNHEHPPLVKICFALSHLLFHTKLHWLDDSTAFRLPAFVFSGVLTWSLYWLARPYGRAAAILAPALFWAVPRHFFHGHLACFDMPVVATYCVFFLAYARAIETGQGAWKAGVAFGLALAAKHNGFFLPIIAVLHWLITDRRDLWIAGWRGFLGRVPRALWAMALLGPTIVYVLWPYLWHHPIERVAWWLGFHMHHVDYPWQYFGTVLRAPPFPVLYPVALEALTIPAATLVAMTIGLLIAASRVAGSFSGHVRTWAGQATTREWLLIIGGGITIAPFMTRRVPIFGGIKHWMAAPAVASIGAAVAIVWMAQQLTRSRGRLLAGVLGAIVLVPGCWATAHFQPYGTSAYNEIAGGGAGGAQLGMQRQYWSGNVVGVLDWINAHAPPNANVFFHEVNYESFMAYQANGYLRRDIRYAFGPEDAQIVAYQYHQEFRDYEFRTWNAFGTRVPAVSLAVDGAPQIIVYVRRGTPLTPSGAIRRVVPGMPLRFRFQG